MFVIGLTGGICSGKSTVTQILQSKYDVLVIDADKLGHEAYEPGTECMQQLVAHFGDQIVTSDGNIDRRILGGRVFNDKTKMSELQSIVWPHICLKIVSRLEAAKAANVKLVAVEAAVMIEAGWQDLVDSLWVIVVEPEVSVQRLMLRNNLTAEEAQKRVDAQLSNAERSSYATVIIDNSRDVSHLEILVAANMQAYST
jgi:phosphopantetheine adenylyltransferase/dephospho-CoA kinase